jgi:hypothetical protein
LSCWSAALWGFTLLPASIPGGLWAPHRLVGPFHPWMRSLWNFSGAERTGRVAPAGSSTCTGEAALITLSLRPRPVAPPVRRKRGQSAKSGFCWSPSSLAVISFTQTGLPILLREAASPTVNPEEPFRQVLAPPVPSPSTDLSALSAALQFWSDFRPSYLDRNWRRAAPATVTGHRGGPAGGGGLLPSWEWRAPITGRRSSSPSRT